MRTPEARRSLFIFLAVISVALGFALRTNHIWEDYYITWRSSQNLATGHGLVYTKGERLHTFTSPLGVLLPAVASLLTGNRSDMAALWVFRLMSISALGVAAVLLAGAVGRRAGGSLGILLAVGWLAFDAKTVDFAINGMETGFLVLFVAYSLWAHLTPGPRQWRHLGAAWAGLMWTRPDAFITIGLLAAGFWLFDDPAKSGIRRGELFRTYLRAGLLTSALYLPWLLWSWGYYGSPIPNTIAAKSGIGEPRSVANFLMTVVKLPVTAWSSAGSSEATFLPAYHLFGGWPPYLVLVARGLAALCGVLWLLPFLRGSTRAASFAFFGLHCYLSYFPYFPFPWYLPGATLLGIYCWASLLAVLPESGSGARWARPLALAAIGIVLAGAGWTTWQAARTFAAQQRLVEEGNRRRIGEWLRDRSQPGDAVFMEPLGYIGYFSGLKTYDFPGMSSAEVVQARRVIGNSWAKLIANLRPRWVVLRPNEVNGVNDDDLEVLTRTYRIAQEFSVIDAVETLDVRGLPYLKFDARFIVYERVPEQVLDVPAADTSPFPMHPMTVDGVDMTFAHAPSALVRPVPRDAARGVVKFCITAGAYADAGDATDGAVFSVELAEAGKLSVLARRVLDPARRATDRGIMEFEFDLPPRAGPATLVLRAMPRGTTVKDWTCWSEVEFR
jgi:hypothetical protein